MRILILKPSSLGDIVHAIPVLRLLRLNFPSAEIYWWVDSHFAGIFENDKDLNGLLIFNRNNWHKFSWLKTFCSTLSFARNKNFDLVIDLQGLLRSGLFGWLSNSPNIIGVDQEREGATAFYDVFIRRPAINAHAVDWYLEVLRYLKAPVHFNFEWLPEDNKAKESVSKKWSLDKRRYLAICPGARWITKRLPREYFAEIARIISGQEKDMDFVVIGGKDCSEIAELMKTVIGEKCINTATRTTIKEMIEIIRLSEFFISNDTGPLHIAAALKKPLLSFFGPTEPKRTGPYGFPQGVMQADLPCVPCFKRKCRNNIELECLKRLTPEVIVEKFYQIKSSPMAYKYSVA